MNQTQGLESIHPHTQKDCMSVVALLTVARKRNNTNAHQPANGGENGTYQYGGISVTHEEDGALTRATSWMNLENVVLSERSQTQKTMY